VALTSAPVRFVALDVGDGALPSRILSGMPAAFETLPETTPPARIVAEHGRAPVELNAEAEIAARINALRIARGLPAIASSASLNLVARAHAGDLLLNRPDQGGCNVHSWSDAGDWTPVCYTPDHSGAQAMWSKPEELTGGAYPGRGFEIAWRGPFGRVSPASAVAGWLESGAHAAVLVEDGAWAGADWKAMGVGVAGPYAVVWFGRRADPAG
jgi:hypothetical protein